MSNSLEPFRTLGAFGCFCRASTGSYAPTIMAEETHGLCIECENRPVHLHSCRSLNPALIDEVGGLELCTDTLLTPNTLGTSKYIPVVTGDFLHRDKIFLLTDEYLGIPLRVLMKMVRTKSSQLPEVLRKRKIIAFLTGTDEHIEYDAWCRYPAIGTLLQQLDVFAVIPPNFSVFWGRCPVGHQYNLQRSLFYAQYLSRLGIPVIPHFYFVNEYQVRRIARYLRTHTEIGVVAINCQSQKSDFDRMMFYKHLGMLMESVDIHNVILEGARMTDISLTQPYANRIALANKLPFFYAINGRMLHCDEACGLRRTSGEDVTTAERLTGLTIHNLENTRRYVEVCV